MAVFQPSRQRLDIAASAPDKPFCRLVHGVDVIVAIVEKVADLLPRGPARRRILPPDPIIQRRQPFVRCPVRAVEGQERMRQFGRRRSHHLKLGHSRGLVKNRIGQRLTHVSNQTGGFVGVQWGDVEPLFCQCQNGGARQRAVVPFHLVKVT